MSDSPSTKNGYYYFPDAEVVRVTTVLGHYQDFSRVPADDLEFAGLRGTAVHHGTTLMDGLVPGEGLDWSTVKPEVAGYLKGWERFRADTGFEASSIELVVRSRTYGYAGTLDRIGLFDGQPTVLDIKTGAINSFVPLQLAAYRQAAKETDGVELEDISRHSVHLTADGNYSCCRWEKDEEDFQTFLVMLSLWRWFRQERLLRAEKKTATSASRASWSREMLEGLSTLDDEGMAEKLARLAALKGAVSEHRALDKALKDHWEGNERTLVKSQDHGSWLVEGRDGERHYKAQPYKEARTSRSWTTTYTLINDEDG